MHNKKEIDHATGVETTGHEWDGLKELNNPLPRWWVWVFIVCCVWAVCYWVVFPSWPIPGGATKGIEGYTQAKELAESQQQITARQEAYMAEFKNASLQDIMKNQKLYEFAIAGGGSAFRQNCAVCHGTGAEGGPGFPNLNDDDWLWGGTLADIQQTITHGIRSNDPDARVSQMPAFGKDGLLQKEEIEAVVGYVMTLSGGPHEADYAKGKDVFEANCTACHGPDGKGMRDMGSANLTDKIWLYGGDRQTIYQTVYNGRGGVMPAWGERLDPETIKELTIYVHQLGGGEADAGQAADAPAAQ
ncbi:MAG: cytochrome-c oxidase, cbb3-type subunit III [Rhodospirillales bacterium]|nr:cytochrome-c oxidase, cbb3-type subunit III [Alphaproteobacteria bacterium]MCB9987287.1 cytochrome-c oxidase, cbb3-type subunit III [Rhodospirillales bacterium]USO07856.1 MAG: cytochrome-c oxidase, cbb3-type subunit III [Rhodospirillales bacterium]